MNKKEFHQGIDIAALEGTDLIAVWDGTISEVRDSMTYGKIVKYETVNGYTIMYAHCKDIFVKVGDAVEQGQIIASVGSTGLSTGPHLHYGIWRKGQLLDPMAFVKLKFTTEVSQEYKKRGQIFP